MDCRRISGVSACPGWLSWENQTHQLPDDMAPWRPGWEFWIFSPWHGSSLEGLEGRNDMIWLHCWSGTFITLLVHFLILDDLGISHIWSRCTAPLFEVVVVFGCYCFLSDFYKIVIDEVGLEGLCVHWSNPLLRIHICVLLIHYEKNWEVFFTFQFCSV